MAVHHATWLGSAPEHWNIGQLRYLVECLDGRRVPLSSEQRGEMQGEIPYWGANNVIDHVNDWLFDEPLVLLGEDGAPFLEPNRDVAFCTSGKIWVNNHAHVLRCGRRLNPRFLTYALNCVDYTNYISGSTRDKLTQQSMGSIPMQLPPLFDQTTIVCYLDQADSRIRNYIRSKERLIALLTEQKQAVINQAVTRGLDPNVPYKSSDLDWLGDVPAHWESRRLKQVSVVQTGIALGKNYDGFELTERPYLRVANVQAGHLDLSVVKNVRVPASEIKRATLKVGDVLMTEGGDIDKLGRGCVWRGEIPDCLHQNHIFAVRLDRTFLLPQFLVALMESSHGRNYFQVTAKQTTNLAATNRATLGNFPMFLPKIAEQRDILEYIGRQSCAITAAIRHTSHQIELMQEYRTRLIADVVTGKLDVRGAVPDEIEAPTL